MKPRTDLTALLGLNALTFVLKIEQKTDDSGTWWEVNSIPANPQVVQVANNSIINLKVKEAGSPASITFTVVPGNIWGSTVKQLVDNIVEDRKLFNDLAKVAEDAYMELSKLEKNMGIALSTGPLTGVDDAAMFFVKKPAFVGNMRQHIQLELVPTVLCRTGCGEEHIRDDYRAKTADRLPPELRAIADKLPPGMLDIAVVDTSGDKAVILIADRDGRMATSGFGDTMKDLLIQHFQPMVMSYIPIIVEEREAVIASSKKLLEGAAVEVAAIRAALDRAGVILSTMDRSVQDLISLADGTMSPKPATATPRVEAAS